jgi:hypothetical protein
MTKNKLNYTELKKRTETPQKIPFNASRLPAKKICIGGYTWEFPPNTIDTDIWLAYPVKNRPYWSLWSKDFCGTVDYIDRKAAGKLRSVLPAEPDDDENAIILYLLMKFISDPYNYSCTYMDITCNSFDVSILYAAELSLENASNGTADIEQYLESSPKKTSAENHRYSFPGIPRTGN